MSDYAHAKFVPAGTKYGSRKSDPLPEPMVEVQAGHGRALIDAEGTARLIDNLKHARNELVDATAVSHQ